MGNQLLSGLETGSHHRTCPPSSLLTMITNLSPLLVLALSTTVLAGDINRQSIIFNENTPDVFYCPQEKPISIDRMLVKSKPMKKLCEYEGRGLPENVKSDCWNDVDETEYACSVSSAEIGSSQKYSDFISGKEENNVEDESPWSR